MKMHIDPKHLTQISLLVANYYNNHNIVAPGDTSTITLTLTNLDGEVTASCADVHNFNIHLLKESAEEVWEREHGTEKFYGHKIANVLSLLSRSKCTMYHLASTSELEMLKKRNCGRRTRDRIKKWLEEEHGLCLGFKFPEEIANQFDDEDLNGGRWVKLGEKIASGEV